MAARAGADLIGLVGPMPSGPGILSLDTAREIATDAPVWTTPTLLTSSETANDISRDASACGVHAVQIVRHVDPRVHHALMRDMPALRRIQVIHVEDETCLDLIGAYGSSVEAFLLDSGRPSRAELGGTGRTHDWSLSAAFVRRSPVPVFLAGGLTPKNVADALAQVRPFGIDVCTGVRTGGRLDPAKLASFIAAMGDPV